jgi:Ca-activated chloride channel family protein
MKINRILTALLLLCTATVYTQSAHNQLRKGDRLYDKKDYQQAENAYLRAETDPAAPYNAGNAAYQQGKYEAAAELFKKAAAIATDMTAKAAALYNLGNALLQQDKFEDAITAYEKSLRTQPNQPDTKKNLQIAKNKLREQQEPPPPPPKKQPPPPPPPPRNNYVDRAQQPPRKELPSGNMTAEAARQMLDATIEQEEQKNARQYRALPPEARPARTKKDW